MIINIQDDILKLNSIKVLGKLLVDKTTKKNIMWATDAYDYAGELYERNKEITVQSITGDNASVLKTRARKELENQEKRTRQHAEVFTPVWLCNMMNNHVDEIWFGRKDVFNAEGEPTSAIAFNEDKTWHDYVDSRRLEITCGEAPFLVSRYDVETGEMIPIERRIGILDRKLRVVNENAASEAEWMEWAIKAFQATYGYEFQGDNLLIARVNFLMTFEEYIESRWKRKPTSKEYEKIANIIAWNIWQMDGLTGTIPYCKAAEETLQMTMFDLLGEGLDSSEEEETQPLCRIYDWKGKNASVEFVSLKEKR